LAANQGLPCVGCIQISGCSSASLSKPGPSVGKRCISPLVGKTLWGFEGLLYCIYKSNVLATGTVANCGDPGIRFIIPTNKDLIVGMVAGNSSLSYTGDSVDRLEFCNFLSFLPFLFGSELD
jgi:hypothetical protein